MPVTVADYRPRDAEHAVLHRVIDEHLEAFLETAKRHTDGSPLPGFVEQEFRDFLTCGVLAHGFARLRFGFFGAQSAKICQRRKREQGQAFRISFGGHKRERPQVKRQSLENLRPRESRNPRML